LAKQDFAVNTSKTGENFVISVIFYCYVTRPSIEGEKGVNEIYKYVFVVDTSQIVHNISSPVGRNRGES